MRVSGEIVAMALNATDWHRSEIQTFLYEQEDGTQRHVVRDCTKPAGEQVLWERVVPKSEYEATFALKQLAKERAEADVIAERINTLMGNR